MKKRYAYVPSFGPAGELTPTEEEAVAWLWDSPHLLNWPHKINWLWSHVDTRKSVARLWGIDSAGTLIIVEIRKDCGDEPDPFANFVLEIKELWTDRDWTAEAVREKWRKCGPREQIDDKRQRSVQRSLKRRNNVGNPHPVLVGVIASTRREFRLSSRAHRNFEKLQKCVGIERVRRSVISGTFRWNGLRVQCTTFDGNDEFPPAGAFAANEQRGRRTSRRSPCSGQARGSRCGRRFVVRSSAGTRRGRGDIQRRATEACDTADTCLARAPAQRRASPAT